MMVFMLVDRLLDFIGIVTIIYLTYRLTSYLNGLRHARKDK